MSALINMAHNKLNCKTIFFYYYYKNDISYFFFIIFNLNNLIFDWFSTNITQN